MLCDLKKSNLEVDGLAALIGSIEFVCIAGEYRVEHYSGNCCERQTRKGDGSACDVEGDSADGIEAESGNEDNCCDDEVAGLGEVYLILNNVSDADSGYHTIEDEGNAADDGSGNGVYQSGELGQAGKQDRGYGCYLDNAGIVNLGERQNACILAVGGVSGAAECCREAGCDTIAQQGTMQTGGSDVVLTGSSRDSGDIADMLHNGCECDGHDVMMAEASNFIMVMGARAKMRDSFATASKLTSPIASAAT